MTTTAGNALLCLASGLLLVLTFPRFDCTWLAPVALAPLLIGVARERSFWRRFAWCHAAGVLYWASVCYWIRNVLADHAGMDGALVWLAFVLFCLIKALHLGVFGALAGWFMPGPYAAPVIAALWAGLERTHGPLGFAWLALGNAAVDMGVPMRLAPITGVYGLSFVMAMIAAAIALLVMRRPRRDLLWLAALPLLYLLPPLPDAARGAESAVVLQPNVPASIRWTEETAAATRERLLSLSLESWLKERTANPRLIVWPEMPAPLYYESEGRFRQQIQDLARVTSLPLLFSGVAFSDDARPLNSAYLIGPEGRVVDRYDKMFLVPFGEFVPPLFSWVNKVSGEAGDFLPGRRVVVFPSGGHKLGTFICYESVFPHLVRRFSAGGAEVFFNLSNDAYFGRSAAHEQHLLIARMRAAENRRWLLRATNDGITVAVDPAGRILQRLQPHQEASGLLRFSFVNGTTPYTRHGDWFAWSCLAVALVFAARQALPQRVA